MTIRPEIVDHWPELSTLLPADFDLEATARSRGAFTRARGVKNAETLLRLALAYGGLGMSLRETCAWAEAGEIARLSDPSLFHRVRKAGPWLGDILAALIAEQASGPVARWAGYRLRVLDGTAICQPGADRTTWRLHVGYDLANGQVDQLELTDEHGGENLQRLSYQAGDVVLADRIYSSQPFDLFGRLAAQTEQEGEVQVRVHEDIPGASPSQPLVLRLVIRRKDPEHVEAEQKRLRQNASKRGKKLDPRTLDAAKYILLLTSLPVETFPKADILTLYRSRWQIELAFKRFKSLAGLDKLPVKEPRLARAWIYARLIVAIIAERIAGQVPESPPSGIDKTAREPIALAPDEDGSGHHCRRHTWAAPLAHQSWPLHQIKPSHL